MKNMTEGHPLKLIFFFAIPIMLGNILQQLYTIVDTMIVGKFLGVNALASIGAADWINWGFLGAVIGFAQGFSILISHSFGANDEENMKKGLGHILILCTIVGISMTCIAYFSIRPLLELLNTPYDIIDQSQIYLKYITSGLFIVTFYNCFSCLLRALGNSKAPLIAMIIASLANIILDYLFIVYFHMGIGGAAIATVIAQCMAMVFCAYTLYKQLPFHLNRQDFIFKPKLCLKLLKLGCPLAFQQLVVCIGGIVIQSVVNGYGLLFVAGYTATNKLYGILEMAGLSFGYSLTTYTSQNYGAKKYNRVLNGVKIANILSLCTSLFIAFIIILFGKHLLMIFISGTPSEIETVLSVGYKYLCYMAYFLPVLYILHTYKSALQGLSNTILPMISGFIELLMRISIALIFPLFMGSEGLFLAEVSAWAGAAIFLFISYQIKSKELKHA